MAASIGKLQGVVDASGMCLVYAHSAESIIDPLNHPMRELNLRISGNEAD
jgi:hypothetical protein